MEKKVVMKEVMIIADSMISPLGQGSDVNFEKISEGSGGVTVQDDPLLSNRPLAAARITGILDNGEATRFESMCLRALEAIVDRFPLPPGRTVMILSTTKGNIDLVRRRPDHPRVHLPATAAFLAKKTGLEKTIVVSNACVSGVLALITARRLLRAGKFDHALVVGADELTHFVVSGFQSLQAMSCGPCRPFDASRDGINLGEAAAAMLVSVRPEDFGVRPQAKLSGGGLTNDANHISGPSRTGRELHDAITAALKESGLDSTDIDFISAHGTATRYNDEMEAKAFNLAGLQQTPLNSLKGFYGHTLGAAGVLETVLSVQSLLANQLIPTAGYARLGTSQPVNVITTPEQRPLKAFLKTASGFGGCNAALVVEKV